MSAQLGVDQEIAVGSGDSEGAAPIGGVDIY
jgi:hypothetical protein